MEFVHKIVICGSSHILEIDLQSSDFFRKISYAAVFYVKTIVERRFCAEI
ncbi:hypothetical protein LEP1GSC151_1818 [Leptospira interrogans serovar Grippotyphosa str. LT2186]|uniref:Uncharacterized protein n=1 Tax=Leptospira interrogans serovar Grippotyphosa str. LT2186 TaxID=1001599 RepID=M3IAX1_LEPIR|nr:hypothetical protein LEP1GSC151_1818 [Leptospira interrogans serovar Grippotyphosa str. LT2186]